MVLVPILQVIMCLSYYKFCFFDLQVSCLISMLFPTPPPPLPAAACLLFAKSSVCWNPIIYLILNPQVTPPASSAWFIISQHFQFQAEFQSVFGVRVPDFIRVRSSRRRRRIRTRRQVSLKGFKIYLYCDELVN